MTVGHGGLFPLAFVVLLGIALEVASAWSLVVRVGKDISGKEVMPGREEVAELWRAMKVRSGTLPGRPH